MNSNFKSSSFYKAPKLEDLNVRTPEYKVPEFFATSKTLDDPTLKALQSQKDNLTKRLNAVGVNPDNPDEVDNRNIIERALNLTPDQNLLFDIFEVIDRPVQAAKGLMTGGLEGAFKGLTGEQEMTGVEFLEETGLIADADSLSGVGKFLANVGTDIVLDPLTYIAPIKLLKKTGILSKKSFEVVKKTVNTTEQFINKDLAKGLTLKASKSGDNFVTASGRVVYSKNQLLNRFEEVAGTSKDGVKLYKRIGDDEAAILERVRNNAAKGGDLAAAEEIITRNEVGNLLSGRLQKYSDNFIIVREKMSNNLADLSIYYKTIHNGDEVYVALKNLEVKRMFKTTKVLKKTARGVRETSKSLEATGPSFTFKLTDKGLDITSDLDPAIKSKIKQRLDNFKFRNGDSFLEKAKKYQASIKGGKAQLTKAEKIEFQELIRELWFDMEDANYFLGMTDGGLGVFSKDEIIKNADIDIRLMDSGKDTIRLRNFIGKNFADTLPLSDLTDMTDDLVDNLIRVQEIEVAQEVIEKGIIAKVLDTKMFTENKLFSEPVRLVKRAYTSIAFAFNAKLGTSKTFQGALRRVGGEQAQKLHEYSTKILRVKKDLLAKNSNAAKLVHELAEVVGERAQGVISLANRNYTGYEILDTIYQLSVNGNTPFLPEIADDAMRANILTSLNDMLEYKDISLKLVKGRNGVNQVILDGNIADLADFLKANEGRLNNLKLSFGKKQISDTAIDFYRTNFEAIDELLTVQDDMARLLVKELGYENLPEALKEQVGYIRHYMTDSAKKGLRGTTPFQNADWIMAGTDTLKKRTFLGTADEINAGLREFYGLEFDVIGTDAFVAVEELVRVTMTKLEQSKTLELILNQADEGATPLLKAIDNTKDALESLGPEFIPLKESFKGEFSNLYKNLAPDAQKILDTHLANIGLTQGKALVMHRTAHGILTRVNRAYIELPAIVKGYDKFINFWKGLTLITPGFHLRNAFGNTFNQYAVGMNMVDIGRYNLKASQDLVNFKRLGAVVADGGFDRLSKVDQSAYMRALNYFEDGVSQSRKGVRDLEKLKEALVTARPAERAKLMQRYQQLLELNFTVAERMDDVQRFAIYQWALDNKVDDVASSLKAQNASDNVIEMARRTRAAEIVDEALFDYQNLTSFEKEYMKRLFPFYTFMKNNFIFQMKAIVKNPAAYGRFGRAYDYYNEDIVGIPTDEMPEYMRDNLWLPIPFSVSKDDKEAINYLKLNLTPSDFAELVENPFKRGVTSLAAPLKIPIEIGMGIDTFTGRPLQDFPGQTRKMERGAGALAFLRDEKGNFAVFGNPIFRKAMDDLGLRVPRNYLSISLDLFDSLGGYQGAGEFGTDLSQRFGLTGVQTKESLALTQLYQDLEYLRNLRSLYEQETGEKLPTIDKLP
jgi:hypothetical protein